MSPHFYTVADIFVEYQQFNKILKDLEINCKNPIEFDPKGLVCFKNGILDCENHQFIPVSQDEDFIFREKFFRDYLPFNFQSLDLNPIKDKSTFKKYLLEYCPNIFNWFSLTLKNEDILSFVFCFAAAMVSYP